MTSPLQGALAAKIGKAFGKALFYDAVLTRETPGTPDPSSPWIPGTPTTATYACKAIVDTYSDFAVANSLVDAQDRKVLILATSLSVAPTDLDKVTIRGATYRIISVDTDPADAVWECQCKA